MKRTLTSIAAASVALGTMAAPVAFASTSSGLTWNKYSISANGYMSNPEGFAAQQSGTMTTFMPIYYVMQALKGMGYTVSWTGNVLSIVTPSGVQPDFSNLQLGTGNVTILVNGKPVKMVDTMVEGDPASGGKIKTSYMPIFYINQILTDAGVTPGWNGSGWSMTPPSTNTSGAGKISSITLTGESEGTGSQASPAVSFGSAVTASVTLQDASGNPLSGVNATLKVTANSGGAPSVTSNGVTLAPTSSSGNVFKYAVPTNAQGMATASLSVGSNVSANYTLKFEAPFNQNGSTVAVASGSAYVEFVAPNTMGLSPATGYNASVTNSSNNNAGLIPVVVTLPPNSATPQSGVAVTFSLGSNSASAFFASSTGGSIGTGNQVVYTGSNGQATVYVNATSIGSVTITASTTQYGNVQTTINWNQGGIATKLANEAVTGYQTNNDVTNYTSGAVYQANIGNNVSFQATAEDQNGNPVPNAQLLIVSSTTNTGTGAANNSAHGNYVVGSTSTAFPSAAVNSVIGSTNPSQLGEVVSADASGNFSFTVNDNENNIDAYEVYAIQGGTVAGTTGTTPATGNNPLWTQYVQWQTGTTLQTIGIQGAAGEVKYDSQSVTGMIAGAQTSFSSAAGLPVIRFDGFNGKDPISSNLNETYTVSASGEADGSIYGVHVDVPASGVTLDSTGYYALNPGQRGVGSASIRVTADPSISNVYDVYVNGKLIGYNVQSAWNDTTTTATIGSTSYNADGQKPGTIQVAAADDDSGNVTVTVSSGSAKATAAIAFVGGTAVEGANFTPSQVLLSNGRSEDLKFTLEDSNGNPVPDALGTVTFNDASNLWITKINGVALSMSEPAPGGNGSTTAATPIPLFDFSSKTNPLGYSSTGVNVAGVGSWTPTNGTGSQTVQAYSDTNGNITLTLQDGAVSYYTSNANQTVAAPAGGNGSSMVSVYSPVNESNYSSTYQVYVGPTNPGSKIGSGTPWDVQGTINW